MVTVASLVLLAVLTVAWTVGVIVSLCTSAFSKDLVGPLRAIELLLLMACLLLFLHLRRLRWARLGPTRTPEFRSKGEDSAARELMPWSTDKIAGAYRSRRSWLYRLRRSAGSSPSRQRHARSAKRRVAPPPVPRRTVSSGLAPVKLERVEQLLGNALYQLDLTRGQHSLTWAQAAEIRTVGVRASTWLNSRKEFGVRADLGDDVVADQLKVGVQRYSQLAKAAEGLLAGQVEVAVVMAASAELARRIE
jgi:hypothetical protein